MCIFFHLIIFVYFLQCSSCTVIIKGYCVFFPSAANSFIVSIWPVAWDWAAGWLEGGLGAAGRGAGRRPTAGAHGVPSQAWGSQAPGGAGLGAFGGGPRAALPGGPAAGHSPGVAQLLDELHVLIQEGTERAEPRARGHKGPGSGSSPGPCGFRGVLPHASRPALRVPEGGAAATLVLHPRAGPLAVSPRRGGDRSAERSPRVQGDQAADGASTSVR